MPHAREKEQRGLFACVPFDNVQSGSSLNDVADLARLECKGGLLKFLLHVTLAKESPERIVSTFTGLPQLRYHLQITSLSRAAAIALGRCQVTKTGRSTSDSCLMTKNDAHGLILVPCYLCFSPARRSPRVFVLDQ